LGAPRTPVREQVADIFLGVGIPPPVPVVESYSSKLIGEMVATGDRAVSIVPADIAEELVRIAGVAIVPYSFYWTLPPIAMFTRATGSRRPADRLVADSLRQVCHEIYVRPDP
jgi:DNA-binding transcriptional LysR family regulator